MIELTNVLIAKRHPLVNASFDKGLNYISDEKLFTFLNLKKKPIDGKIVIDNNEIFLDDTKTSFFVLAINSAVICLTICYIQDDNFKQNKEIIINELNGLKDMPLNNEEEKREKISSIFKIVNKFPISYCLINFNDEINKQNESNILDVIKAYESEIPFIVLQKKMENEVAKDNSSINQKEVLTKKERKNYNNETRNYFLYLKNEIVLYVLLMIECLIDVFLVCLTPFYFAKSDFVFAVLCTVLSILLLVFVIYFNCSSFSISIKKKEKNKYAFKNYFYLISAMIFSFLGFALSIGLFFLLKNFNILIENELYNNLFIIYPIVFGLVVTLVPFLSKPINNLIVKIKNSK